MTFLPDDRASELRDLFFESAEEILQAMNEAGLALEERPGDNESLRSVRRAVHTLKGDSAACGYRELSELAHELEDVLTPELVKQHAALIAEVVLTAADTFHEMLAAYRNNLTPPIGAALREHIQRLLRKPASSAVAGIETRTCCRQIQLDGVRAIANLLNRSGAAKAFIKSRCIWRQTACCRRPLLSSAKKALERAGKILALRPEKSSEVSSGGIIEAALSSNKTPDWIRTHCQVPSVVAQISVERVPLLNTPPRDVLDILVEAEAAAVAAEVAAETAGYSETRDEGSHAAPGPSGLGAGRYRKYLARRCWPDRHGNEPGRRTDHRQIDAATHYRRIRAQIRKGSAPREIFRCAGFPVAHSERVAEVGDENPHGPGGAAVPPVSKGGS